MAEDDFHDRFERAFNARIPRHVAASFSAEQLAAVKTAFGAERWDGHPVDLRATVPLLRWYVVFVAGRDRRDKSRLDLDDSPKPSILGRIIGGAVALLMLALLAFLLIGVMAG
jgi:hypothetical protein